MDWGQVIAVYSRLILGAAAVFLAIILWVKTREVFWVLMVLTTITAYVEIIYSIMNIMGISAGNFLFAGSVSLTALLLPVLRIIFLIAAFLAAVIKIWRKK